jgi:NTP pyrophosphatase (non-canonical NTP hydrolase)
MSDNTQLEIITKQWFKDRNIIPNATVNSQFVKTLEEVSELCSAINSNDISEIEDAIGDIIVTLVGVAELSGTTLNKCWNKAYNEIKDRKGYLDQFGIFHKEQK